MQYSIDECLYVVTNEFELMNITLRNKKSSDDLRFLAPAVWAPTIKMSVHYRQTTKPTGLVGYERKTWSKIRTLALEEQLSTMDRTHQ